MAVDLQQTCRLVYSCRLLCQRKVIVLNTAFWESPIMWKLRSALPHYIITNRASPSLVGTHERCAVLQTFLLSEMLSIELWQPKI